MEFATALLSASVQPLIERLISHELDKFARRENIHAEIKDWETMLAEINPLLDDAEDKQSDTAVKNWLDDFRDLTYDIEDVLDEFNTEALKHKVMEDSQAITNKLRKLKNKMISFQFKDKMASRLKKITQRLQHINERQEKTLNLRRIASGSRSNQLKESRLTTCLVDESHICGRDVEKEAILQMLLRDEGGNNPISVIAILGMGGIGKTTLAQQVYNHSAVEDYFDIKAWVCVSENFDVTILTRTILRQVSPETPKLNDLELNSLQVTLKKELSQKKFLLIMDDVWEEDYNQWDRLRIPFISASSSSKIVVTTRKNNAAPIATGASTYSVKELPDDECLSILARHALAAQSFDTHLDLKEIGQKLVKRCDGLPLAAKVLGGLLRNKRSRGEWELIRNKLWNSPETSKSIHPILKLSYNDLPSHLKRCFVYCAIIPKDYEFDRDELISLWMAEGFLDHPQGGTLMEDLGIEYFEELVSRSFFQSSKSNQSAVSKIIQFGLSLLPKSTRLVFVMHDLISDLAQTIAKDTCYNYENKLEGDMSCPKYEKVRHASFSHLQNSQEYEVYSRMKNLRTIVGFPILRKYQTEAWIPELCHKNCYEFSPQSSCLRVLSLTVCGLPKSIGDLKHLRHLNLSFSTIEQLPESVSTLLNLHTLLLHGCFRLKKLPDKTRNLVNLRHFDIAQTYKLLKLPSGIGMLTNLQTLSKFIVGKDDGTTVAELKNLNNLRGSLSIEGLQNVQDAKLAILKEKQGLEELVLKWDDHHVRNDMSVLEALEPHENLKRLTISYYGVAEFPSWVTNIHLYFELVSLKLKRCENLLSLDGLMMQDDNKNQPQSCLEHLTIHYCRGLTSLPNGKLPAALKTLEIQGCSMELESAISEKNTALERIDIRDNDSVKAFPSIDCLQSLKHLSISGCPALESFPEMGFLNTSLQKLRINNCQNLSLLPSQMQSHFPSLRELSIRHCPNLGSRSVTTLVMGQCENMMQPIEEWGLGNLSSLWRLGVSGICPATACVVSFPDDNCCWLPTSLIVLNMADFLNLESVTVGLQKLTSLKTLEIRDCPKLRSLPREALPHSLRQLSIYRCPLLKEHYSTGKMELLTIHYKD